MIAVLMHYNSIGTSLPLAAVELSNCQWTSYWYSNPTSGINCWYHYHYL